MYINYTLKKIDLLVPFIMLNLHHKNNNNNNKKRISDMT